MSGKPGLIYQIKGSVIMQIDRNKVIRNIRINLRKMSDAELRAVALVCHHITKGYKNETGETIRPDEMVFDDDDSDLDEEE